MDWWQRILNPKADVLENFEETLTYKALKWYGIILLIELVPLVGGILAVTLAMTLIAFLLPHLVMLAICVDVKNRKLVKQFLLIPLIVYGVYYAVFAGQYLYIKGYEIYLRGVNPARILKYDPHHHDLVLKREVDVKRLFREYKIPVVYLDGRKVVSYRPTSQQQCEKLRVAGVGRRKNISCTFLEFGRDAKGSMSRYLRAEESPHNDVIKVTVDAPDDVYSKNKPSFILRLIGSTYTFYHRGREIGRFRKASYYQMPVFPLWTFGCVSFGFHRMTCSGGFYPGGRSRRDLEVVPDAAQGGFHNGDPIGAMLEIPRKNDEGDIEMSPETDLIINRLLE